MDNEARIWPTPRPNAAGETYCPSNGTEGDYFHASLCHRCAKWRDGGCRIVAMMLAFRPDEPEYPREIVYSPAGWPSCTAFREPAPPAPPAPRRPPSAYHPRNAVGDMFEMEKANV